MRLLSKDTFLAKTIACADADIDDLEKADIPGIVSVAYKVAVGDPKLIIQARSFFGNAAAHKKINMRSRGKAIIYK